MLLQLDVNSFFGYQTQRHLRFSNISGPPRASFPSGRQPWRTFSWASWSRTSRLWAKNGIRWWRLLTMPRSGTVDCKNLESSRVGASIVIIEFKWFSTHVQLHINSKPVLTSKFIQFMWFPWSLLWLGQGGGDINVLSTPESEGEAAVANFLEFLTNNNMK